MKKRKRRLSPYIPVEDESRCLEKMRALASALTAHKIEFSNKLTYCHEMAPRSANKADLEDGGMQVLSKEDTETVEMCLAMSEQGQFPPLLVVYDSLEGYAVEADNNIKDLTFLAEYTGDVDYINNRERDDCDSMMTLLLAKDSSKSLVICPDKRGNIARFISGINNHTRLGSTNEQLDKGLDKGCGHIFRWVWMLQLRKGSLKDVCFSKVLKEKSTVILIATSNPYTLCTIVSARNQHHRAGKQY